MKLEKAQKRAGSLLEHGETILAAVKVSPEGMSSKFILGAAGTVAGTNVGAEYTGIGAVVGNKLGESASEAGQSERADAGLELGSSLQVVMAATDQSVVFFQLSATGRFKSVYARISRSELAEVEYGSTKVFGQTMGQIVLVLTSGARLGFDVAKVHRAAGEELVAALA